MRLSPCPPEEAAALLRGQSAVLDIGCGDGALLRCLAESGAPYLAAAEPDRALADEARAACPEADIRYGSAEALPFESGVFDAAVMECVFSLTEPRATVSELRRVLKLGGTALVTDLYARRGGAEASGCAMVKNIYTRERMESFFSDAFELMSFDDRSDGLTRLLMQLMMDGALCSCLSGSAVRQLKEARAGYAVWVWRKNEE